MNMNILIIDGNEKKASDSYLEIGMQTQYEIYRNILKKLLNKDFNIVTIHPACKDNFIPAGLSLDDFQGIVWTGSLLNIYDSGPAIERQIELAKELFTKKNKIFGSCWGLQVLNTAAGGSVRRNPRGLEAIIANDITINKNGIGHLMYKNKPIKFDSFCWHYDEVDRIAADAVVLSSNNKSSIQALSFQRNNSNIWAVQYHPEFNAKWISLLMKQRKKILIKENIFNSNNDFDDLYSYLSDIGNSEHLRKKLAISESLLENNIHTLELFNWLEYVKSDI
jgi:GMP synthase (glutamine-hydrolysing)